MCSQKVPNCGQKPFQLARALPPVRQVDYREIMAPYRVEQDQDGTAAVRPASGQGLTTCTTDTGSDRTRYPHTTEFATTKNLHMCN
ncbi:hypothetical protein GUJ93_ZPchr0006g41500 [Zizania palustris]|uniref:Uncharacterized protein n=1 Tax=Zizania palustris TaxID=103762 RepID=A0A8J5SFF9_ZIZPA|nr:hypothetical protein GUJ93_ZPchr0006g41500 [Zizania palustris]